MVYGNLWSSFHKLILKLKEGKWVTVEERTKTPRNLVQDQVRNSNDSAISVSKRKSCIKLKVKK